MEPFKFVRHDVPLLESLKDSTVFNLYRNRHKLSRQEKDQLFERLSTNSYSRSSVPLMGWMFPFSDVLKVFLVNLKHYGWEELCAPDKTSIRAYHGHDVLRIVELDIP